MYYSFHVHSEFSTRDGLPSVTSIAKRSQELGCDAFCITDHGHPGAWIEAFKTQDKLGIQFIPGFEAYLEPEPEYWVWNKANNDGVETSDLAVKYHHITLFAKNQTGLQNLIKMYNRHEMHYGKEIISRETLFEYGEGVIVLSGCVAGEAIFYIQNGMPDKAKEILKLYKDKFGDDFYAEIQYHNLTSLQMSEAEIYNKLVELAKELDIKLVPTSDSHYVYPEEQAEHNIYKAIHADNGGFYNYDNDRFPISFDGTGYHINSEEEIREAISNIPALTLQDIDQAIQNTVDIRNKCEKTEFPRAIPLSDKSEELEKLVWEGFDKFRKGTKCEEESRERIKFELDIINQLNFSEYFINVRTITNRAHELGILLGAARGSAGGSEIVNLLDIIHVDPLKHGLMFERFLNPSRSNYPDIDIDIQSEKDGKLGKDILIESLSQDIFPFSGQIQNEIRSTVATLFRQLASKIGIKNSDVNRVTTDISFKENYSQAKCYDGWLPDILKRLGIIQDYKWDVLEKHIDFCYKYGGASGETPGILWNTSVHASGVIFYPGDNTDILPKRDKCVIYNGHALEDMGFIKYDLLSLAALNIMHDFIPKIEEKTGKPFDWEDTDDKEVWKNVFHTADSDFVFQFSSPGMKRLLKNTKPNSVPQLAELNALYRPGALNAGIVENFIQGELDEVDVTVGEFLQEEFGEDHSKAMIFQEDIMKIVQGMAGFSLAEADNVRRGIGKKDLATLMTLENDFLSKFDSEKYGDIGPAVWDKIKEFAAYTFNKSHSIAYSINAYWQAYIWTHFHREACEWYLNKGRKQDRLSMIPYLSKDHNLVYPTLATTNKEYVVNDTEVLFPTQFDTDGTETFGHFLLNLNADRNKMIVKHGILDNICTDRKGLRELGKAIPAKKVEALDEIALEMIYDSENLEDFLDNLSVNQLIDYEKIEGGYKVIVHKARSDAELELHTGLTKEINKFNAGEDITTYGLARELYADRAPDIPFDEIAEKVNNTDCSDMESDYKNTEKKRAICKKVGTAMSAHALSQTYNAVLLKSEITGSKARADIAFNNAELSVGVKRNARAFIKSCDKKTPLVFEFAADWYINKDGEVDYRLAIVDAYDPYDYYNENEMEEGAE